MNRTIEGTNFLICFRNKDGEEVTIDPNNGFDIVLKYNFCNRLLHNCYLTMTETNEPGFPYTENHIGGDHETSIFNLRIPQFSFDIYPDYFQDIAVVPEPEKESDNVEEPLIDETEKLTSNIILKLEVK